MLKKLLIFILFFPIFAFFANGKNFSADGIVRINLNENTFIGVEINNEGDVLTIIPNIDSNAELYMYKKSKDSLCFYKSKLKYRDSNSGLSIISSLGFRENSSPLFLGETSLLVGDSATLLSFSKKDSAELARLVGWNGFSGDVATELNSLKAKISQARSPEEKKEIESHFRALYNTAIKKFLDSLGLSVEADLNLQSFVLNRENISVLEALKANSPLEEGQDKPLSVLTSKNNFSLGAPVINKKGNLVALSFVRADASVVYLDLSEILKFLSVNNISFNEEARKGLAESGFNLFSNDYVIIVSIVIIVLIIFIFLFKKTRSRSCKDVDFGGVETLEREEIVIDSKDESPTPVVQERIKQSSIEVPKLISGYNFVFSKVKNTSLSEMVSTIKKIISTNITPSNINLYKLAKDYQEAQADADKRLSKCIALINKGNDEEAINMAVAYPSLVDVINDIQFSELENWIDFCIKENIPVPSVISPSEIHSLNALLATLKSQNLEHSMKFRKFVSLGNLKSAIELLETSLSLEPNNKKIEGQLISLKNSYLDKEITKISQLAQKEQHKEAIGLYNELSAMISDPIKNNNPRWAKVQAYAREKKLEAATSLLRDTILSLKLDDVSNWEDTFELVLIVEKCIESFPELEESVDMEMLSSKKILATELKNEEIADKEFRALCDSVVSFMEKVKLCFSEGRASRDVLRGELAEAMRLWEDMKLAQKTIPIEIYESHEKCIKFLREEISSMEKRKGRILMLASVIVLIAVGAVAFVKYNNSLKMSAYSDYYALKNLDDSSFAIEKKLKILDAKYVDYKDIPEFVFIRNEILENAKSEYNFEKEATSLASEIRQYNLDRLKGMKSFDIKAKEEEFNARLEILFAKLSDSVKIDELTSAKKFLELSLMSYANIKEQEVGQARNKIFRDLENSRKKILAQYNKGLFVVDEVEVFRNNLDELKAFKDPYVKDVEASVLEDFDSFLEEVKTMEEVISTTGLSVESLLGATDYNLYIQDVKSMVDYYEKHNISDDRYKNLKKISLKWERLLLDSNQYYMKQSSIAKALFSSRDLVSSSSTFSDLYLIPNKDAFAMDFAKVFPFWVRNIYSYNYEYYNKSDEPAVVKPFYTISKANTITNIKEDKASSYNGNKVTESSDIITEFNPLNTSDFSVNETEKLSSISIQVIRYLTKTAVKTANLGEQLVNAQYLKESRFLSDIFMRTYDENMLDIVSGVSILDILSEITQNKDINDNFKVYLLINIIALMEKYAPVESGLLYSPSLMNLKDILAKDGNHRLNSPLSWTKSENKIFEDLSYVLKRFSIKEEGEVVKILSSMKEIDSFATIVFSDGYEHLKKEKVYFEIKANTLLVHDKNSLTKLPMGTLLLEIPKNNIIEPSEELSVALSYLASEKLSFKDESNLCFEVVSAMSNPNVELVGIFNEAGKNDKAASVIGKNLVYFYYDDKETLQSTPQVPSKGLPFSPILAVKDKNEFLKEIVLSKLKGNRYIYDSIAKYIFP